MFLNSSSPYILDQSRCISVIPFSFGLIAISFHDIISFVIKSTQSSFPADFCIAKFNPQYLGFVFLSSIKIIALVLVIDSSLTLILTFYVF